MKHRRPDGSPDTLTYSFEISKIKSHKERMLYMSDLDEKFHDLVYLVCMQMGLPQTIADLPTREERKKAWEELPEHNRTFKGMKDMVYHRVVRIFKEQR
jgi:hypothetical protein|tara:strand:+ start:3451 stop:3747 length:297 start_codon:yes stop_codon:yes gene_type:complete